ncbi:MAG: tetratricopeptide repeat protein [Verrucomicrobiota bacterium]
MDKQTLQDRIDDATFDFTLGDAKSAIEKLNQILATEPASFEAWHALTEVQFSEGHYDEALEAGERALALRSDDIHINVSLSRVWVERGDKEKAEYYGAQARMLGWKDELKSPPPTDNSGTL